MHELWFVINPPITLHHEVKTLQESAPLVSILWITHEELVTQRDLKHSTWLNSKITASNTKEKPTSS